jgi:hypothetical protein
MAGFDNVTLILGGLGLLFLAIGLVFGKVQAGRGGHARAMGTVIDVEISESYDNDRDQRRVTTHYRPVVRFEPAPGQAVVIKATVTSNLNSFKLGQAVEVRYNPDQPEKGIFESAFRRFVGPVIFVAVGAAMTIAALLVQPG